MSSSTSEEKENPVVTLRTQADGFDFSKLRAGEDNAKANSGETMLLDFYRMSFVINKKSIDNTLTIALIKGAEQNGLEKSWDEHCKNEKTPDRKKTDQYKKKFEEFYNLGTEHTHLLPKEETGDYRPFAKEVFKEMFKYAKAEVPSDPILEELVTNCNQAAYLGALYDEDRPLFHVTKAHELTFGSSHTTHINCYDSDCVAIIVKERISTSTFAKPSEELCKLDSSLEFTLESQDGKNGVTYKNGKLSLTVPERLKDYNIGDKSLFDIIKERFQKLCEKLGFFKIKIERGLGNPLEVNSCVEDPNVGFFSNERGVDN